MGEACHGGLGATTKSYGSSCCKLDKFTLADRAILCRACSLQALRAGAYMNQQQRAWPRF